MRQVSAALWLACVGAAFQAVSLFTDFYVYEGARRSAWYGVPHTSHLILLAWLLTAGLVGLTVAKRSPVSGKTAGWIIGVAGLLASFQIAYRMAAPPFGAKEPGAYTIIGGSCLYYCWPSQAMSADVLGGMWMALTASIAVALGGIVHAVWDTKEHVPPRPWRAAEQPGKTPWLGTAAIGALGQFVFGYTVFTFYTSRGEDGATTWSGWLATPHTGVFVLAMTVIAAGLVWSAARKRAPMKPTLLGIVLGILGAISAGQIAYRILQPPFRAAVEIGPGAYLALLSALVIVVSGYMHARNYWRASG